MISKLMAAGLFSLGAVQPMADPAHWSIVGETPDARVAPPLGIAPGPPPVLSFRLYEGKLHQRFNNSALMLDDAGH